jgi:hypothetical protein
MERKHITELLPEYLDGLLEGAQRQEVEEHLRTCGECAKELRELKILLGAFEREGKAVPPESLTTNFYALLEKEKELASKGVQISGERGRAWNGWAVTGLRAAAGVALLIGAFFLGKYREAQVHHKEIAFLRAETLEVRQTAMLSLMENRSASKRIQGVNYITQLHHLDKDIINALTDRMLYDENTNVRLTAVEALGKFTTSGKVKATFITALKTERDPTVQIAIIHTLVRIQEKKALAPMRELLGQEDTQPFVKEQIESLIPSII